MRKVKAESQAIGKINLLLTLFSFALFVISILAFKLSGQLPNNWCLISILAVSAGCSVYAVQVVISRIRSDMIPVKVVSINKGDDDEIDKLISDLELALMRRNNKDDC